MKRGRQIEVGQVIVVIMQTNWGKMYCTTDSQTASRSLGYLPILRKKEGKNNLKIRMKEEEEEEEERNRKMTTNQRKKKKEVRQIWNDRKDIRKIRGRGRWRKWKSRKRYWDVERVRRIEGTGKWK